MKQIFSKELQAHVMLDDAGRARSIRHSVQPWGSEENVVTQAAISYLRAVAPTYGIATERLVDMYQQVSYLDPREQGDEYRLAEIKGSFDMSTLSFHQTVKNVPVWQSGVSVTMKKGPNRILRSVNTSKDGIEVTLPPKKVIDQYKHLFAYAEARRALEKVKVTGVMLQEDSETEEFVKSVLKLPHVTVTRRKGRKASTAEKGFAIIRGRFWIYQYKEADRLPPGTGSAGVATPAESAATIRMPAVPPVDKHIQEGRWYLTAEITFTVETAGQPMNWQVIIELETGSWLYLRPLFAGVNGRVFAYTTNGVVFPIDPVSQGAAGVSAASNNAALNPCSDLVPLERLNAPAPGDNQSLTGTWVHLSDDKAPDIDPPTETVGDDFDYQPRTNNFAAVSAYLLCDRIFEVMADLGFDIQDSITPKKGYFNETEFPIHVDHRASYSDPNGIEINAFCGGNGHGGIGLVGFCLCDLSDTTNPLGRAVDSRVYWHEVCGHGILFENADNNGLFRFCHSAGDALSLIFHDPWSSAPDRFRYAPFHPTLSRRADRDVADGWAWGGPMDDWNSTWKYKAEEIMETTLFRIYRSIGGDAPWHDRRVFASRMVMYLIFRAVRDLNTTNSPEYAREWADALMAADNGDWTSENIYGGAYSKVIRWAFEKQGEYQDPLLTHASTDWGTVTTAGRPEAQDVYIDDGRHGEYEYIERHWETEAIWNRRIDDGLDGHEEPALGETNYMYVRIKNRGTQAATNVKVRGYHSKPGAGLSWPDDFQAFTTAEIAVGTVGPNDTDEKPVGPFEWTPDINALGHDCVLMIVSSDEDPSNADKIPTGKQIAEWRLVPNDNNIGQRNVNPVPGGGGEQGLMAGLNGVSFLVGNPNPRRGKMTFNVTLPSLLSRLGWRLELVGVGDGFTLASGAKCEVFIKLHPGKPFTRDEVEATNDRTIRIDVMANDNLIGGMTYRLDPDLSRPWNADRPKDKSCLEAYRTCLFMMLITALLTAALVVDSGTQTGGVAVLGGIPIVALLAGTVYLWIKKCRPTTCLLLRALLTGSAVGAIFLAVVLLFGQPTSPLVAALLVSAGVSAATAIVGWLKGCYK
jgi:hypothetical protein